MGVAREEQRAERLARLLGGGATTGLARSCGIRPETLHARRFTARSGRDGVIRVVSQDRRLAPVP